MRKRHFLDNKREKKEVLITLAGHYCWCHHTLSLQVVLQNLLMCMVCFYSLYYMVVSLCIGLLRYENPLDGQRLAVLQTAHRHIVVCCVRRVHEINSLLAPFDYTTQPSWQNPKFLGEWRCRKRTTEDWSLTTREKTLKPNSRFPM